MNKKQDVERERCSNPRLFFTSARRANHSVKCGWTSDCRFQEVTEMVGHSHSNLGVRKVWEEGVSIAI